MEQVLGHPQDIEWALDQDTPSGKNIFLLQTRSAKCLAKKTAAESKEVVDRLIGFTDLTKVAEKIKGIAFKF
jgi:phosphoenolpyruvate synthase/pyruvate phosphate dikinase